MRKFAATNLDTFLNIKNDKNVSIKCVSSYQDYSTYENEFIKAFENYFVMNDGNLFILFFRGCRYSYGRK